jgi:hypothetical protein
MPQRMIAFASSRIALIVTGYLTLTLFPAHPVEAWQGLSFPDHNWIDAFVRWDSFWYQAIIDPHPRFLPVGYSHANFFPLYAWVGHIARKVYGADATVDNPEIMRHYSRVPLDGLPLDKHGDPVVPDGAYFSEYNIDRADPILVRVVEEMGAGHRTGASGQYSNLVVVEIPDGTEYTIEEYDGQEHIAEVHQTWG